MDPIRMINVAAKAAAEKMKAKQEALMPRQAAPSSSFPHLKMSVDEFTTHVLDIIEKGNELLEAYNPYSDYDIPRFAKDFAKWNLKGSTLLRIAYSTDEHADKFDHVFRYSMDTDLPDEIKMDEYRRNLQEKIQVLEESLEQLQLLKLYQSSEQAVAKKEPVGKEYSNEIFIVHGHDKTATLSLENLLLRIGLKPVVLWREADRGQTIIEKFEAHSNAGYAFALLTPDEIAYLAAEEEKPDVQRKKCRRARPNVIFEMGYFFAKLGRDRVCCLLRGDVERPSDIDGILFKPFNNLPENIASELVKELRAAGYDVTTP